MITCPQCTKLNPENFNYCLDCGADLHPEETHSAESQFFLDLSAQSPDVKRAREDAGMDRTPAPAPRSPLAETPAPRPTIKPEPIPAAPAPQRVPEPRHITLTTQAAPLELSPDDLLDDLDSDLDTPLFKRATSDALPVAEIHAEAPLADLDEPEFIETPEALPVAQPDEFDDIATDDSLGLLDGDEFLDDSLDNLEEVVGEAVADSEDVLPDALDSIDHEDFGEIDWHQEPVVEEIPASLSETPSPLPSPEQAIAMRETLKPEDSPPEEGDFLELLEEERVDLDQGQESLAQAKSPRCTACGAALRENDKFCGTCGAKVAAAPAEGSGQTMFMHVGAGEEKQAAVGKLVILEPSGREGRSFTLTEGENLCGRNGDAVLLDDRFVSPTHCRFVFEGGQMRVIDCDSANGVFVKVKGETPLASGAMLRIGQQLLLFQALEDFDVDPGSASGDGTRFLGSPVAGIWGKLIHITHQGRVLGHYPLRNESLVLGREVGDVLFPQDGFVSGTHAKLMHKDGRCVVLDLGSSNGTFVQVKEQILNPQDMVLIGKKLMRFERV